MNADYNKILSGSAHFKKKAGAFAPDWLQKVGEQFGMGVAILDNQNNILLCNDSFVQDCNLPPYIIEKTDRFEDWLQFMEDRGDFPSENLSNQPATFMELINTGSPVKKILTDISPPNGKVLEFKCMDSDAGILTIFSEDITVKKRNEESLSLALEMGKSGYFYHIIETEETYLESDYLQQLLTKEEYQKIRDHGFWPIMHEDDVDKVKTDWQNIVLTGNMLESAVRIITQQNGPLTFKFTVKPVTSSQGSVVRVIGFFEDVTHEFKIRRALRKAKEESEQSLKSKTDFLARISHEIRTPMNAVIGIADALIHHNKDLAILPKLELIQSSADGILNILDDTLSHAKLKSEEFTLDPKPGDPRKSIRSVCALWEAKAAQNKVTINCEIDGNVPGEISFDRHRYEQCLNNLLSNAIKFTPGGKIDVFAKLIDKNGLSRLVLAVRDNGIGMNRDQAARIFDPFKQADQTIAERFGGTGLGMNITKSLIEKMGGNITVKSELGKGTIFAMSLPLGKAKAQTITDPLEEKEEAPATPYEKLKILVADDNPTNHLVVKSLLEGIVAEIVTANDGQDVLDILQVQPIDIILMDIHMPIMDGIESTLAIRSAKKPWSDVIIIALTADPEYQQKRLCLNIGMDFAVAKPVKLVDLMDAFDHVLPMRDQSGTFKKSA